MAIGTSTSTDPVQTLIDILDGSDAAEFTNGEPEFIERQEATPYEDKVRRDEPAVYAWSPEDGSREQIAPTTDPNALGVDQDQNEVVNLDCWSRSSTRSTQLAGDVETILGNYWNDKSPDTKWLRIRATQVDDRTSEARVRQAPSAVVSIRVELRREKTIGA